MLRAAAALFQLSWPSCLPLALVGVLASGAPGAQSIQSGESHGLRHSGEWWGLYAASGLLTLACYGAVMLRQQALIAGTPLSAFDALRRSVFALPAAAVSAVLYLLAAPFVLPLLWLSLGWLTAVWERRGPREACRRSASLVRGNAVRLAGAYLATIAAVLVFILLGGIFFGVVMALAGQAGARAGAALSGMLFSALLSLPVVFVSAVLVSCYQTLRQVAADPQSPPDS